MLMMAFLGDAPSAPSAPPATSDTPTTWDNTRENTATANYIRTSCFSSVTYQITGDFTINSYNDVYASFPQFTELGVYIDGVYQKVSPGGAGARSNVVSNSGTHTVTIVNGLQSKPASAVLGTFLVSVDAPGGISRVAGVPTGTVVFYGDSITAGGNATNPTGEAFPMLVRQAASVTVGAEAYGYRTLYDDCSDGTARAAFVAKIVAWNPAKLVMTIGVNDYGLNKWSAANFQTAYAALLDDLHTALPSLTIYAQSPIRKDTGEGANSFGDTLPNYRTAISNAAAGRAWVTYVDGLTVLDGRGLADGLHPSTDGHYGYAEFWRYTLGYSSPAVSATIANRVNTTVSAVDLFGLYLVTKTGGTGGAWDADATTATGFAGDFTIRARNLDDTANWMVAANADPATNASFTSLDFAFFKAGNVLKIYESGAEISTAINPFISTYCASLFIARRGTTLTYRIGYKFETATVLRTVNGVTGTLYFDSSIRGASDAFRAGIY